MKIKPISKGSPEFKAYSEHMMTELRKLYPAPRPKTTDQCDSTREALNRTEKQSAERRKELTDINFWLDLKERSKAPHSETCERKIDPDQYSHLETVRRRPKNTLGQSEKSASSPERREKAEHAFRYSQPADLTVQQMEKLTELNKIVEYTDLPPEIKKTGFFKKLLNKLIKPDDNLSYAERREKLDEYSKEKK